MECQFFIHTNFALMPATFPAGSFHSMKNPELLEEARLCWESWSDFRKMRARCKRYTYGRQWDDPVTIGGQTMTEEEFIRREGHIPLKNNLIRRLVRSVLGTWLDSREECLCLPSDVGGDPLEAEAINNLLQASRARNSDTELSLRAMEEFLISGLAVRRKSFGMRSDSPDIVTECVSPDNFFIDINSCDVRGNDAELVGEIHDVPFGRLCAALAHSRSDYARLASIYTPEKIAAGLAATVPDSFFAPSRAGLCRVVEVWRRERRPRYRCHDPRSGTVYRIEAADYAMAVEQENQRRRRRGREAGLAEKDIPLIRARWFVDETWRYYYLSPEGHILTQGESPFSHSRHPYVYKAYPFIDGEIHSFVADIIDQQRHINRLITIFDWVMRASAKGVLLFPEEALPRGWTLSDISDQWCRHNGVIMIKTKDGTPLPQQVSSNSVNIGIVELLNVQKQMLEDISGVNSALQGKLSGGNVSGALYDYQTRNSLTALLDILESFRAFERESTRLDISLLRQYAPATSGTDKDTLEDSPINFADENKN